MKLDYGTKVADEIIELVRPSCEWVEVAGSIRRMVPTVNDIELVLVPSVVANPYGGGGDLFGHAQAAMVNLLGNKLGELRRDGLLSPRLDKNNRAAWGSKFVRALWKNSIPVDLFMVLPPAQLGLIYFIRTGDADYAHSGLARWKEVTPGGYSEGGALRQADGTIVETPDESAVYRALQWDFIRPSRRNAQRIKPDELPVQPATPAPVFKPDNPTSIFHTCDKLGPLVEVEAGLWRSTCTACGKPHDGGLT